MFTILKHFFVFEKYVSIIKNAINKIVVFLNFSHQLEKLVHLSHWLPRYKMLQKICAQFYIIPIYSKIVNDIKISYTAKQFHFIDFTSGYQIVSKSMQWVKSWKCSIYFFLCRYLGMIISLDFGEFWDMLLWKTISIIDINLSFAYCFSVRPNILVSTIIWYRSYQVWLAAGKEVYNRHITVLFLLTDMQTPPLPPQKG